MQLRRAHRARHRLPIPRNAKLQIAAAQQQNFNLDNSANYNVDITNCNNNWAENNAAYTADGIVGPPNTCANDQFGLTPTVTGGYTGSTTGPQPSGAIAPPFTPGASTAATGSTGSNPSFTFTNLTSGNNSSFNVGDRWQIQITGAAPNAAVVVNGGQTGANASSQMGTTDSTGSFSMNGQMDASQVGSWSEQWTVGGKQVASFGFTVNPTGSAAGNSTATGGSVTGSFSDLLSGSTTVGGSSIPDWAIAAGALVILFMVMKK